MLKHPTALTILREHGRYPVHLEHLLPNQKSVKLFMSASLGNLYIICILYW